MASLIDILLSVLTQMLFTVGVIIAAGLVIALINKKFYQFLGHGSAVCLITGVIGTPVHELAHAGMCLIFGHKIKEIKLFQLDGDGTLGYVKHSYNKKNFYHLIGNFFIGVAPILLGSAVLVLLLYLLSPSAFFSLTALFPSGGAAESFSAVWKMLLSFFSVKNLADGGWWLFLLIGSTVALHMNLSSADIKTSKTGILFIFAVFFIVDLILGLIGKNLLAAATDAVLTGGAFIVIFLFLSLVLSILLLCISAVIYGFRKLIKGKHSA